MTRFDFTVPEEDGDGPPVGIGEALDGRIRASVVEQGKLHKLTISPELLRHARDGASPDSRVLAAEITDAVNAALVDFASRAAAPAALGAELSDISTDLSRALHGVRAELERAERRITDR